MIATRQHRSIRVQILSGAVILFMALLAAFGLWVRQYAERAADEAFDRVLAASALSIAEAVQLDEGFLTVDIPPSALAMLGTTRVTRVFYKVESSTGAFLTGYRDLASDHPAAQQIEPTFKTAVYRGTPVRLVTAGRYIVALDLTGWATIYVAETLEARERLFREIVLAALLPAALVGCLALALVAIGLGRAFKPFKDLERQLSARQPSDLTPIETSCPREVAPVVGALNGMFARLKSNLDRMRDLVADAAHQLRTPLAALRAQAELALDEADSAVLRRRVERIHANAVGASQLASQLLSDATVAHRLQTLPPVDIDLVAAARTVLDRLHEAQRARIRLVGPSQTEGLLAVSGDALAIQEMLQNLIDNAVKYAPDSIVDVCIDDFGMRRIRLRVQDRGPGIRADDRARVLARFERGQHAEPIPGSGLGLAIAASVAHALGGELALGDTPGGGLTVSVILPRSSTSARGLGPLSLSRAVVLAAALLLATPQQPCAAEVDRLLPSSARATETLRIASDGEHDTMLALARAFQAKTPDLAVEYRRLDAGLLHHSVVTARISGDGPDVAISGAVDLQTKLVNDGFVIRHRSRETERLPSWAQWRDEAFGLTAEQVVFAFNPAAIAARDQPRSRLRLAQMLEQNRAKYAGRVITYDIARSGVGYVFAAFDASISLAYWRLTRALGDADVKLAETSLDMIDALARGDADIAYNVAGSSAVLAAARARGISIVHPDDYTIVVARVAVISQAARNPAAAARFIDFALSAEGQAIIADAALLPPASAAPQSTFAAPTRPVALGPGALIFTDARKRARFLDTWIQLTLKP